MKAGYLGRHIKHRYGSLSLLATSPGLKRRLEEVAMALEPALLRKDTVRAGRRRRLSIDASCCA